MVSVILQVVSRVTYLIEESESENAGLIFFIVITGNAMENSHFHGNSPLETIVWNSIYSYS